MYTNIGGASNTATGIYSLYANTTGDFNVAVGTQALTANTTADGNTAIGYQAGFSNTTGTELTAIGYFSGKANTTGTSNTAVGFNSLTLNTTGASNNAFGSGALYNNTEGTDNIAVGVNALVTNTTGSNNVGIGRQALTANTTGTEGVAIGHRALADVTTGGANIGIGISTGDGVHGAALTTGSSNILIGRQTDVAAADNSYSITMGVHATGKGSSTGFISPNDGAVYQGNNASAWAQTSDRRIKKNIVNNTVGLDVVNQVQVRNFEYRTKDEITEVPSHAAINQQGVQLGVIAQEIQALLPNMVNEESTGVLSVNADNMTWYLVNAVQELSAKNDALEARLAILEGE